MANNIKQNTRKNRTRKANNSVKQQTGGKRKLSPALKKWNQHVMEVYRKMKKTNKNYKLRDAMKVAKKTFKKH